MHTVKPLSVIPFMFLDKIGSQVHFRGMKMNFTHPFLLYLFLSISVLPLMAEARYVETSENICTPVDFRETFELKMRNQNKLSWCYAHAAADYLQFTYRIPEQISAADIAINYSKSKWSRFVTLVRNTFNKKARGEPAQTGLIKHAVQMIRPQGYCPESSLPSDEWTKIYPDGRTEKVEILTAVMESFQLQKQVRSGAILSSEELPWRYHFQNISTREEFFNLLRDSKRKNFLSKLRSMACAPDRKPFPSSESVYGKMYIRGPLTFARINGSIDWARAPVTIDFFSDILENYDRPKRRISELHTVLLYGRKFNVETQQCEYLIKDSYGASCEKYDPKIKCESGYLWLPENKLYKQMTSFYSLFSEPSETETDPSLLP
jgi:hypothetical protein